LALKEKKMMHYNDIVVSICDQRKKALREYDSQRLENGRKTTIHVPFDTEYQILVKNNQFKNIRLDIDIDGSNVSNDGFIIRSWSSCYLERFLNSDRKFKFVPVSNEGVSDPSSNENGIITVVAHFEKQPEIKTYIAPRQPWGHMKGMRGLNHTPVYGSSLDSQWMGQQPMTYSSYSVSCSVSDLAGCPDGYVNVPAYGGLGEAGATVEGGKSSQKFVEAQWNGDDPLVRPVTFKFKLLGMNNQDSKDWQDYQRLKEKFNAA
jgi:hypothetical protein